MCLKGKDYQTLAGHSIDVLEVCRNYQLLHGKVIENKLTELGFEPNLWVRAVELASLFHDTGKVTERWQDYLEKGLGRITHALFSFATFHFLLHGKEKNKILQPEWAAAMLAVLGHHGMLHDGTFTGENINALGKLSYQQIPVKEMIKELLKHCNEQLHDDIPENIFTGSANARLVIGLKIFVQRLNEQDKLRFKALYTIFLAALQLSDNSASKLYDLTIKGMDKPVLQGSLSKGVSNFPLLINSCQVWQGFIHSIQGSYPNDMQQEVRSLKPRYAILRAGCGSGKTAAALHYAVKLAEQKIINRVIFTLPTQFTTNSIYWDMMQKYGIKSEFIGIYHSEVDSILHTEVDGESSGIIDNEQYIRDEKYINCFFHKPVNVCTVDHLLYSLLHCHRYADRAFGNIMTAAVIFDEIHYYDSFTLQKIGQCLEILRNLKIPHLVMSATIPDSIIEYLKDESNLDDMAYDVIQPVVNEGEPFRIKKLKEPMVNREGHISEFLLSKVEQMLPYRQLIVVNQVEKAKAVFRVIKKRFPFANVICYHSEFTRTDRDAKERLILSVFRESCLRSVEDLDVIKREGMNESAGVILVSTQVCELSLDISADVLYSEIAPVDAVAQRGGRLHRKGKYEYVSDDCVCDQCKKGRLPRDFAYVMYLFPIDWTDQYAALPYRNIARDKNILGRSWEIIEQNYSYSRVVEWVNKIYTQALEMRDDMMLSMVLEDVVFGRKPKERYGDATNEVSSGSFKARQASYVSVTVVPDSKYTEDIGAEELLKKYGVRVNRNKLMRFKDHWKVKGKHKNINILNVPYNKTYGFKFNNIN